MPVTVRPAAPADAETIAAFNRAMAEETEGLVLDPVQALAGVRAVLDEPARGFYLLAEARGEVVGQLMVTPEWSDWRNGCFWWVQSVYVAPAARQQGVFGALVEAVETLAGRRIDVRGLRLYVHRHNIAAQHAYRRAGWRPADYDLYERGVKGNGH